MSDQELIGVVRRYLDKHQPDGVPIEIVERGVRWEGAWWQIPVRLTEEIARRTHFYDELADAEIEIKNNEGISVLFFPVGTSATPVINGVS